MKREWVDVSVPIRDGMVHWPGDPGIRVGRVHDLSKGDVCTVSSLAIGSHTGTHMDAPAHFLRGGATIDAMPPEATVGPARVVPIRDRTAIRAAELKRHRLRRGERVLFKTRNSARCWRSDAFVKDFVYIAQDGARFLAEAGVRMVGVDYLSVGGYAKDGVETHHALLGAGIWIVEGLNLSKARPGPCELVCLPLRFEHGDGAPARAFLRQRKGASR